MLPIFAKAKNFSPSFRSPRPAIKIGYKFQTQPRFSGCRDISFRNIATHKLFAKTFDVKPLFSQRMTKTKTVLNSTEYNKIIRAFARGKKKEGNHQIISIFDILIEWLNTL